MELTAFEFGPVAMQVVEATSWPTAPTLVSQHELVYILAGQGQYTSGHEQTAYQPGDLFLLQPSHLAWFCSPQPTRFCVVGLSAQLLRAVHAAFGWVTPNCAQSCFRGSPPLTAEDKAYVSQQLAFCLREHAQPQAFGDNLVQASLMSVLLVLRRAHIQLDPTVVLTASFSESQVSAMVAYVRQHLKEPQRLSATAIGAHFHQRPRYVGQHFRQHMGRGLKQFVLESRVLAIQQELRFTGKTISQLAFEYGFADESHLGKVFKDITRQTPLHYRTAWTTAVFVATPV